MSTHTFPTSGDAYDACQTGIHFAFDGEYPVETGDILVIEKEKVVGIADTRPVAVTKERGHLHTPAAGVALCVCLEGRLPSMDVIDQAKKLAAERGWPVRD
ncbi:hypothetical protein [Bradyrhizobium erythrophlei]|uniref:Uncharacterized protein n=1 Tax=Bradyrhizobium erythrophlei TaxID=1437360 RepID=A0A1M5NIH2_9BRAD|nr:hypothetical protein [Bradyrhizobium erythrophlei]SHG89366.1 hypothetical protein SAMN05443248_3011 [Bradyrhizobium erythrophlei]